MDRRLLLIIIIAALLCIVAVFILSNEKTEEQPATLELQTHQNQAPIQGTNESPHIEPAVQNQSILVAQPARANMTSTGTVAKTQRLELVKWTDAKISIDAPVGWDVYTGGECATKSILARDPQNELKQLFYFSEAGPVYTSQKAKDNDEAYMNMGGSVLWYDSPVVDPLTSENYLTNFHTLVSGDIMREVFHQAPVLENVKIISTEQQIIPSFATDTKLMHAEFTQNGLEGEGYFYVVTANLPFGGYGTMVVGITAPKGLLELLTPSLKESIGSFTVDQEYISECIALGNKALVGALKTGQILSETSDVIMDSWENRMEAEGRMAEKWGDAMLGSSRLYNPETDEVYEVTPEFLNYYSVHGDEFEMNYLQELSEDKWSSAPLNGGAYIY